MSVFSGLVFFRKDNLDLSGENPFLDQDLINGFARFSPGHGTIILRTGVSVQGTIEGGLPGEKNH